MRIVGLAAEGLHNDGRFEEAFPKKQLDDYWARRPYYEAEEAAAEGSSNLPASHVLEVPDFSTEGGGEKDEAPPPPYSLQAEEPVLPQAPEPHGRDAEEHAPIPAQSATPPQPARPVDALRRNHTAAANSPPSQTDRADLRRNQTVGAQASTSSAPLPSSSHAQQQSFRTPVQRPDRDYGNDFQAASRSPSSIESSTGGVVIPASTPTTPSGHRPYSPRRPTLPRGGGSGGSASSAGYEHQRAGAAPPQQAFAPPPGPPPGHPSYQPPAEPPRRPYPQQAPRPGPVAMSTYDQSAQSTSGQTYQAQPHVPYEPYRPQSTNPHAQHAYAGHDQHGAQPPLPPRPATTPSVPGQHHDPGLRPYAPGWHPAAPQYGRPYQYSPGYVSHPSSGQQRPQQQGVGAFNSALNVVSRVAGQDTRRQIESLADCASFVPCRDSTNCTPQLVQGCWGDSAAPGTRVRCK